MSESNGYKLDQLSFAQRHGALLNEWGGYYRLGKHYGMEKKLAIVETYLYYEQLDKGRPSILKMASEYKVSRKFVQKIESELYTDDRRCIAKGKKFNKKEFVQGLVEGRTVARYPFEAG
jgi:hypothetical protein